MSRSHPIKANGGMHFHDVRVQVKVFTLLIITTMVLVTQPVVGQTLCSSAADCQGGTFLTCVGGTCCNTAKAVGCLKCDSDMDCQTCNVSHYLTQKIKCAKCANGKSSPAGSKKQEDCIAPIDPNQINTTNVTVNSASISTDFPLDTTADTSTDKIFYSFLGTAYVFPFCGLVSVMYWIRAKKCLFFDPEFMVLPTLLLIISWPVISVYTFGHHFQGCQPGAVPGGNVCTVCPIGTFDSANWTDDTSCWDRGNHNVSTNNIFARNILFAEYVPSELCSVNTNDRVCKQCPAGKTSSQTFAAVNDAVCLPCRSPDCNIEICTLEEEGGGNVEGCRCIATAKNILNTKPLEDSTGEISRLFDYSYVFGGETCTKESGVVCSNNGRCSKFTCDGGDCCYVTFDADTSTNAAGCGQSKSQYCTEISKAIFLPNPETRTDVVVNCGEDCQTMVRAKEGVEFMYYINMGDMIVEIVAAIGLTIAVVGEINSIKIVVLAFLGPVDIILQVWVLVLALGTAPTFAALQDAKCLDVTSENGRLYEKTLIELASSVTTTGVFGFFELTIILCEIVLEFNIWKRKDQDAFKKYVGVGMQLVGTLIAIIDFAIFSTQAQESTQSVFSSTIESGSWCVSLSNETKTCAGITELQELGKGYIPSSAESVEDEYFINVNLVPYLGWFVVGLPVMGALIMCLMCTIAIIIH